MGLFVVVVVVVVVVFIFNFKLNITVLDLSNIKMNLPHIKWIHSFQIINL